MAESGLEALARGLRGAGGILSPEVQKAQMQEDVQSNAAADARRNMLAQMTIRGAEAGAIDPVKATEALRGMGIDVPDGAIGPTPEAMARKQQYENDVKFRDAWGRLGPDATLEQRASIASQYGKPELSVQLFNAHEQRLDRVQARADALEMRRIQLEQMSSEKALDRESRENIAKAQDATRRLHEATLGEIARMRQEATDAKAAQIKDEKVRGDVRKMSQDLNKANLPEIDAVLGNVEKALQNPEVASAIATPNSLRPDWTLPAEIRNGKQDFQKLFNITLKNRSGAAVTNQELERLKQEFGAGVFKTPEQIKDAVAKMRGIIQKHYAGIAAGYGKDVLKAYNENLSGMGGSVVLDPDAPAKVVNFSDL